MEEGKLNISNKKEVVWTFKELQNLAIPSTSYCGLCIKQRQEKEISFELHLHSWKQLDFTLLFKQETTWFAWTQSESNYKVTLLYFGSVVRVKSQSSQATLHTSHSHSRNTLAANLSWFTTAWECFLFVCFSGTVHCSWQIWHETTFLFVFISVRSLISCLAKHNKVW